MAHPEKTWWAPVWRGLVVDPEGKHLRRLRMALGLYLYLILHANRRTGRLKKQYATIARDMGLPTRTVRDWMQRLHFYDYIRLTKTGRAMIIEVLKWRPIGRYAAPQRGTTVPVRQAETRHPSDSEPRTSEERPDESERGGLLNENTVTRVIQRDNVVKNFSRSDSEPHGDTEESPTRAELLARDLATGLEDHEHLSRYLSYAERYPESLLRRLLSEARATPERSIKRSKAALFEFLLKQHVVSKTSSESNHPRN